MVSKVKSWISEFTINVFPRPFQLFLTKNVASEYWAREEQCIFAFVGTSRFIIRIPSLINDIIVNTKRKEGEICHLLKSVVTFVLVSCWRSKEPKSLLYEWNIVCQILIIGHLELPSSPGLSSMHTILEEKWVNCLGLWNTWEWQDCLGQDTGLFGPQGNCVAVIFPCL